MYVYVCMSCRLYVPGTNIIFFLKKKKIIFGENKGGRSPVDFPTTAVPGELN